MNTQQEKERVGFSLGRRGFTLLELLTVMAIMLLLMGMTLGTYYGFTRSAGMQGATSNLRATLYEARQFAVTHRRRTHVLFWRDGTNSHYVACMEDGHAAQSTAPNSMWLIADYPMKWDQVRLEKQEIFNLTATNTGIIITNGADRLTATNEATGQPVLWNSSDRYGWALQAQSHLPEGITFEDALHAPNAPQEVIFKSDGTTLLDTGYYAIRLWEQYSTRPAQKYVVVRSMTGQIQVRDDLPP